MSIYLDAVSLLSSDFVVDLYDRSFWRFPGVCCSVVRSVLLKYLVWMLTIHAYVLVH